MLRAHANGGRLSLEAEEVCPNWELRFVSLLLTRYIRVHAVSGLAFLHLATHKDIGPNDESHCLDERDSVTTTGPWNGEDE